jgi:predicted MFS family arabinose efflux permease
MVIDAALYSVMAPLLSHYRHELGLSKAQSGVLVGSFALGTLVSSLPAAALATKINVKRTLVIGLILMSVASVAVGAAHSVVFLDLARFAQGTAGGVIWSASLAWVSALAPEGRRGAVLGRITGIAIAGSLLGPPAGALAATTSPRALFDAIPVIGVILLLLVSRLPAQPAVASRRPWAILRSSSRRGAALGLWLIFAPSLALGLLNVLGPLRLNHLGAGAASIAATFVLAAIAQSVVNVSTGVLTDRVGLRAVVSIALPALGATLLLLVAPRRPIVLAAVVLLVAGIGGAFWAPALVLLSASMKEAGIADSYAFALYNIAWAAGQGLGASGGGTLAQLTADVVPCSVLSLALVSTLAVVSRE